MDMSSTKGTGVMEWLYALTKITHIASLLNKRDYKSFFDFHVNLWTFEVTTSFEYTKCFRKLPAFAVFSHFQFI